MATYPTTPASGAQADRSPRALVDYYLAKFQAEIAVQFAYRGAIFIWLISLVTTPLISLVVWTTVARENGGSAGGFTSGEYAAYFIAVMIVNNLTFTWVMWEMEWRVKNGMFSPMLLRPIHPIHNDVVTNLTFKLLTSIAMVPIAIALAIGFDAEYDTTVWHGLAFVPILLSAHVPPVRAASGPLAWPPSGSPGRMTLNHALRHDYLLPGRAGRAAQPLPGLAAGDRLDPAVPLDDGLSGRRHAWAGRTARTS